MPLSVEVITLLIVVFSAAMIIAAERLFPYTKNLPFFRDGFWVDLVWYTTVQSFLLKILIFDYIILPLDARWAISSLHPISRWPIVIQVLFFLVTHDFYIYWFHRWQHNSSVLWRTHEAHHSTREVDWLAGSRSHAAEILINQSIEFAPIILLGADPMVVPIKACIDAVWGMFIHSNIDVRLGFFKYVINGPQMHRWHHANDNRIFYSNYSTKFSIWDWIFGTAFLPENKPDAYGLYYHYPKDYFLQHLFSIKRFDPDHLDRLTGWWRYLDIRRRIKTISLGIIKNNVEKKHL